MKSHTIASSTLFTIAALASLFLAGCGGSSGSTVTPTPPPGGGGGGGSANMTISIIGMAGPQSFTPNPATVSVGQTVAFTNNDTTTHHIVQDGGAFDTGNLAPGATSAPITINSSAALPYHCVSHPTMVGSINGSTPTTPGGPGY